jgi:hypothetical protein
MFDLASSKTRTVWNKDFGQSGSFATEDRLTELTSGIDERARRIFHGTAED